MPVYSTINSEMSGIFFFHLAQSGSVVQLESDGGGGGGGRSSGSSPPRCSATGAQIDLREVKEDGEEEEREEVESVGVQQFYTYSCPELAELLAFDFYILIL